MRAHAQGREVPWSLVFFTVLTQAAVGLAAVGAALFVVLRGRGASVEGPVGAVSFTAFVVFSLGGLAGLTHLGRPFAARHVGANLRSSWLSREVILGGMFGLALLFPLLPGVGLALGCATALLGLAFVYAVTQVYRVRTVPAWDHWTTPALFFGTVLLLGSALLTLHLPLLATWGSPETNWQQGALRGLALVALLATGWLFALANVRHHRFPPAAGTGRLSLREHRLTLAVRVVALLVGTALLFTTAWWGPGSGRSHMPSFLLAFVLLLVSELIARFSFYASHRRIGL